MNMKLKDLRMSKGISQEKLAQYCSVSRSTVAMWEINKAQPDIETLKKLAEYFETSIDYLIGRTDYTDSENETICKNLQKHLSPNFTGFKAGGHFCTISDEMMDSIFNGTYKFTKYDLLLIAESLNLTEDELLKEKPAENDELENKNVKFIGRDGTVKFKKLSPEMIAMLEQLPDSGDDL